MRQDQAHSFHHSNQGEIWRCLPTRMQSIIYVPTRQLVIVRAVIYPTLSLHPVTYHC